MKLVIVESPKKSETIGKYLGSDFKVLASEGHIRDLSTHGKGGLGIDIEGGFKPDWQLTPAKERVISSLRKAAKDAEVVYLASDPDREGEAIAYHLAEVLHLPLKAQTRLQFREITKPAILEALAHPQQIDMNLVGAQEARRMQDRIIGFMVSGLLQKKISLKSAGRVQSSTLKLIVDKQKNIDAFVPKEYWTIDIDVVIEGKTYKASLTKVDGKPFKCSCKEEADAIVARIPSQLVVSSCVKTPKQVFPKPPFTTSTMQQEAYTKYGFSNTKTQSTAQKLYEGLTVNGEHVGLITYMRTDSTRISENFYLRHAVPYIHEVYGDEYIGKFTKGKKSKKNIQDAHEAIRPTGTHRTPDVVASFVTPDQAKLYRLIYNRAMASLMAPKQVEATSMILSGNGLDFSLSGSRTLFPGFSVLYHDPEEKEEDYLPSLNQNDEVQRKDIHAEQKFTKPEPQYNEASIVRTMEEKGIGRPSTYASTIKTLLDRKYITAVKGVISPTDDGKLAVETLEKFFPDIVSSDYTAMMETKLDKVESGEITSLQNLKDFYSVFIENFEQAKENMEKEKDEETGELCPECGRPLVYKRSKKGQTFIGCSGFPSCKYIKRDAEADQPEYTGENCPDCGSPLIFKKNRKGEKFIGCSNFPKCGYTASLVKGTNKAKVKKVYTESDYVKPCPVCKTGHMVIRETPKAKFLACTNFPKCRHMEWLNKKEK
ncbi:MAG: type I DNA topoisomerase [Bacilli bacterium]|nr:type I DNA topoisomerase [Bacilli bacterium]